MMQTALHYAASMTPKWNQLRSAVLASVPYPPKAFPAHGDNAYKAGTDGPQWGFAGAARPLRVFAD